MKIVGILVYSAFMAVASGTAIIDPALQQRFLSGLGGGSANRENVLISFTQGIQTVIDQINRLNFSSPSEKRTALTNAQQAFSSAFQAPVQTFLNRIGINFQTFWINNKMVVPNVNSQLVNLISNIPGVAKIEKEPKVSINFPGKGTIEDLGNLTRQGRQASLAWGIEKIRADQVWGSYRGKGIVIANIDTGVRYTHQALRGRWRTSYGWYDPYTRSRTPIDRDGHGTHTMGTIAGTNGIGVAPEATWIACRGCSGRSCGGSELYACGQWVQCPTRPDGSRKNCDMAPNIVSNSWGGSGGESWYDDIINSWQTSGIIPVFSIGNSGPECKTAGSPGDRPNNIAVGSTDSDDQISWFSSLGPSNEGLVKPDIVAPGGEVRSAWHTSDSAYKSDSGTSMACPHVSGVIGLMLQKKPGLKYQQIYDAVTSTAVTDLDTSTAKTCAGKSPDSFPNSVFGYGRIDAVDSVNAV